jgi:hypothetical protein|tara:strand:- start:736 stop:1284 length:549 start_codon:yes stop_codon:yes gene_type:complete
MKDLNKGVLLQMIKEQIDEMCGVKPPMHSPMKKQDHEGSMARQQMYKTMNYAQEIYDNVPEDAELPAWVQSKLTKIADYVGSVKHYLEYKYKHSHGMHYEGLQEQDEIEMAGGTVTVDVDTKALAAKIREILPTEAQKDKETMEQLFSDLRSLMDQPATGESPDQQDQSPTQSVLDAFKPAS